MISLPILPFVFLFVQYIVGAIMTVLTGVYILSKRRIKSITVSLFLFGLVTALWEILVFFQRTVDTPEQSILLFRVIGSIYPFIFAFYFLTFLNVWKTRKINLLCLVPSAVASPLLGFSLEYKSEFGTYGWNWEIVRYTPLTSMIYVTSAVLFSILILVLVYLLIKSPNRDIRMKFTKILIVFILFQVIGIVVTNLVIMQTDPNFPPLGGFLSLATFAILSYVIFVPVKGEVIPEILGDTNTSEALTKAIRSFHDNLPTSSYDPLGSSYFELLSYLDKCGLANVIRQMGEGKSSLTTDLEGTDVNSEQLLCFIDTSLTLLERKELDRRYLPRLLEFIDRVYDQISIGVIGVFKKHEHFLISNQIIDEIAGGKLRTLLLPEGSTEKDLTIFSSLIKISHKELTKTPILLKFEPSTDYPSKVRNFVLECLANCQTVYVFTRMGSRLHTDFNGYQKVHYVFLSTSSSKTLKVNEKETIVPASDISQILGTFITIKNSGEPAAVVFDNLTDIFLLTNFEQAYKMARHSLDIQAASGIPMLFLINKEVHGKEIMSTFEALFKIVIV